MKTHNQMHLIPILLKTLRQKTGTIKNLRILENEIIIIIEKILELLSDI